jgi:hypothetical protein
MLEQTLSERIGMRVRLEGEFDLMLLPAIGVSGTGLLIGGPEPDSVFARSHQFEISVALRPLLDQRLLIEWIRLTGGSVYPARYSRSGQPGGVDSPTNITLPEIQELTIRDFQIVLPGEDENAEENQLQVKELTLTGFAAYRETPFTLVIEDLVAAGGALHWDTSQSLIRLGKLQLDLAGQVVSGEGCVFMQPVASLHFDLQAGAFDLDAFRESLPGANAAAGQGSGDLPLEIRGRFTVDELKTSGVLARGVVLSLGDEPACD